MQWASPQPQVIPLLAGTLATAPRCTPLLTLPMGLLTPRLPTGTPPKWVAICLRLVCRTLSLALTNSLGVCNTPGLDPRAPLCTHSHRTSLQVAPNLHRVLHLPSRPHTNTLPALPTVTTALPHNTAPTLTMVPSRPGGPIWARALPPPVCWGLQDWGVRASTPDSLGSPVGELQGFPAPTLLLITSSNTSTKKWACMAHLLGHLPRLAGLHKCTLMDPGFLPAWVAALETAVPAWGWSAVLLLMGPRIAQCLPQHPLQAPMS